MLITATSAVTNDKTKEEYMDTGYCASHDVEYRLANTDDVCPKCLRELKQTQTWRDSMDGVRYD